QMERTVNSNFIQNIFEDNQQRLWVMTQDNGLFSVSSDAKGKPARYFYENETESNLSCIVQADNGNIYIGKLNEGLYRFISKEEGFENIPYSGSHLAIKDLYVVDQQQIYVGTENNRSEERRVGKKCRYQ